MSRIEIKRADRLRGTITVPGDKSISHRGIMLGAIADGVTELSGFLDGADCRSTISCFRRLGIDILQRGDSVTIHGKGLYGLCDPTEPLDVGNSGTTMRLISGILCGAGIRCRLTGDASIRKRPMKRIIEPLSMMGADITSGQEDNCAPLVIGKSSLDGICYHTPVASAQVKSAILLAGLYANGETSITEPAPSRNHTELMLEAFGADISTRDNTSVIRRAKRLEPNRITIPGDISSAAYFIAAAIMTQGSELLIKNVNINPTRAGMLEVLKRMGADIACENKREVCGEVVADLLVKSSGLSGTVIEGDIIPALIDELPVLALLGAYAKGETIIKDAHELRMKESDRIELICDNLIAMGAEVCPRDDGMIINGGRTLAGTRIKTAHDHRIAMTFAIAGLAADGTTTFDDTGCVDISYPGFFEKLYELCFAPQISRQVRRGGLEFGFIL